MGIAIGILILIVLALGGMLIAAYHEGTRIEKKHDEELEVLWRRMSGMLEENSKLNKKLQEAPPYPTPRLSRPQAAPAPTREYPRIVPLSHRATPPAEPPKRTSYHPQQNISVQHTHHDSSLIPGMVLGAMLHESTMETHRNIEHSSPASDPSPSYDSSPACDSSSSYSSGSCGSSDSGGSCCSD